MDFNKLAQEINQINQEKGWNDLDRRPLEIIALIHSEISEATEELMKRKYCSRYINWIDGKTKKPEGFDVELIDAFIRSLGWLAFNNRTVNYSENSTALAFENIYDRYEVTARLHWCLNEATEKYRAGLNHLYELEIFAFAIYEYYVRTNQIELFQRWLNAKIEYNKTRPYRHGNKEA